MVSSGPRLRGAECSVPSGRAAATARRATFAFGLYVVLAVNSAVGCADEKVDQVERLHYDEAFEPVFQRLFGLDPYAETEGEVRLLPQVVVSFNFSSGSRRSGLSPSEYVYRFVIGEAGAVRLEAQHTKGRDLLGQLLDRDESPRSLEDWLVGIEVERWSVDVAKCEGLLSLLDELSSVELVSDSFKKLHLDPKVQTIFVHPDSYEFLLQPDGSTFQLHLSAPDLPPSLLAWMGKVRSTGEACRGGTH